MARGKRPSEITAEVSRFDRFAETMSHFVSRAPFFIFCLALVLIWGPSYFVFRNLDTWQLIINTTTTIITFLMVALLQNSQWRGDAATAKKLNAIAQGLADLMDHVANQSEGESCAHLKEDIKELSAAVGLEQRIDSSKD